jgi:hypothetical protein
MNNIFCPYCDSEEIEPVELSVVKCLVCGEYFDLDDSPHVEKIKHRPHRDDEDDN